MRCTFSGCVARPDERGIYGLLARHIASVAIAVLIVAVAGGAFSAGATAQTPTPTTGGAVNGSC